MDFIYSNVKASTTTTDFWSLSPKTKRDWIQNTLDNLLWIKHHADPQVGYLFEEHLKWKSVLPRRSKASPQGAGMNNPYEFVSELQSSKQHNDLSSKQLAGLNYINWVMCDATFENKLPHKPQVVVDSSTNFIVEYKITGPKKQRIETTQATVQNGANQFHDLFSYDT